MNSLLLYELNIWHLSLIFVFLHIDINIYVFNSWHINESLSHDECFLEQKELLKMVSEQGVVFWNPISYHCYKNLVTGKKHKKEVSVRWLSAKYALKDRGLA